MIAELDRYSDFRRQVRVLIGLKFSAARGLLDMIDSIGSGQTSIGMWANVNVNMINVISVKRGHLRQNGISLQSMHYASFMCTTFGWSLKMQPFCNRTEHARTNDGSRIEIVLNENYEGKK